MVLSLVIGTFTIYVSCVTEVLISHSHSLSKCREALYLLDKCDLNVTPLSFIVKCDYASKIKSTLRIQPSDWL